MSKGELAEFLRSRREALRPDPATDRPDARARRTPGLRREEVAERAGVSANYYERLEQGRGPHPSAQVVGALGRALRLTPPELEHLTRVAGLTPDPPEPPPGVPGLADARELLERLGPVPGYVVDAGQRILAWNAAAVALLTDFAELPDGERTVTALSLRRGGTLCSEPASVRGEFARALAAELRATRARHPDDPALAEQVNAYAAHSPAFADGWRGHDVRPRPVLRKRISHPVAGELDLECRTLIVPGSELRLVLYTAEPGSPSAAALARLTGP